MGGSNSDYSNQINKALTQANTPKSDFSKQYSGFFQGGGYAQALQGLLNGGSLGNASPFQSSGQYNVPGSIFNYNQPQTGQSNNFASPNPTSGTSSNESGSSLIQPQIQSQQNQGQQTLYGQPVPSSTPVGGFTYQDAFPGLDPAKFQGKTFQDLISSGNISQDQALKYFGAVSDPSDPNSNNVISRLLSTPFDNREGGQVPNGNNLVGNGYIDPATGKYVPGPPITLDQAGVNGVNYQQALQNYFNSQPDGQRGAILQNGQFVDPVTGQAVTNVPNNPGYNNLGAGSPSGANLGISGNASNFNFPINQANPNFQTSPGAYNTLLQNTQAPQANPNFQTSPNAYNTLLNSLQTPNINYQPQTANLDNSQINPNNSQYFQAIQNALHQQYDLSSKNLEAQFGASGGSGRGTPAAFAQAQLAAQSLPQLQSALGAAYNQDFQNQLAQRSLSQQGNLANTEQLNQYGLGGAQLASQNILNTAGLNQQGANLALQNYQGQNTLQNSLAQFNAQNSLNTAGLNQQGANLALQNYLGQNNLQNNLSQFNTNQGNSFMQQYLAMQQAANQQQIQNQFQGYQNFAQLASALAGSGIPGGSANVSLGGQSQTWLQQLGGLL